MTEFEARAAAQELADAEGVAFDVWKHTGTPEGVRAGGQIVTPQNRWIARSSIRPAPRRPVWTRMDTIQPSDAPPDPNPLDEQAMNDAIQVVFRVLAPASATFRVDTHRSGMVVVSASGLTAEDVSDLERVARSWNRRANAR